MGWKKWICLVCMMMVLAGSTLGCRKVINPPDNPPTPPPTPEPPPPTPPPVPKTMKIHTLYSVDLNVDLNGSASHNWAQLAADGSVGIAYREIQTDTAGNQTSLLVWKSIAANGVVTREVLLQAAGVENCVLVYDAARRPHVFALVDDGPAQDLRHFVRIAPNSWTSENVTRFANSGGEYVMEMTAVTGPGGFLHLAVLQFGSTPDKYLVANENSNLYYITNKDGAWRQELVEHFDSVYILMNIGYWYMRPLRRQDLVIDAAGKAHIAYGALVHKGSDPFPTEMRYATNAGGSWAVSVALPAPDTSCDAGYNPSLAIDGRGRIALACTYVERVPAKSAQYAQLVYAELTEGNWRRQVLVEEADGYKGFDGGRFTGALPHLRFDSQNLPHIVFSDIASSHVGNGSFLNVGQIRYIRQTGGNWEVRTIYSQASPQAYSTFEEIHGICLMLPPAGEEFRIVAQELVSAGSARKARLIYVNFE